MKIKYLSLGLLLIPLYSCVPNPDGQAIPLIPFPAGSGGGGVSFPAAPAEPMVPPIYLSEDIPSGKYEQHGAVSANDCARMEKRFQKEGRKVKLAKVIKNHLNGGGGVLVVLCLFEGEDANIETDVFQDYRYNSPDETAYP
jgi:hypothetical protein